MRRFMGLMPSDEVQLEHRYLDRNNMRVIIQAGPHGYTILWADHSSNWEDVDDTTENNFEKAYRLAQSLVGPLCCVK